jgi:NAD(P)-dependent dehydrogenase (short-subunit alcohol dehydrogenase family)
MDLSQFSLEGKVAIVTGASRGLGRAIASAFADAGADLVISARTAADIQSTALEMAKQKKRKVIGVAADARFREQVDNLVNETMKEFGRIDILINNAGGTFAASSMKISEGGFDALVRENLKSVFMCSQAVGEKMISQKKGVIINSASYAGIGCANFNPVYGASKAGILSLTRTMAVELAGYNIRVNAVAPGTMATANANLVGQNYPNTTKRIPLGRLGNPEEVTGAYLYLASEASSYVTGTVIVVDGGLLAAAGLLE